MISQLYIANELSVINHNIVARSQQRWKETI